MAPSQKVAVVTGCSPGGLGFFIAKQLHAKGYRVFATTRKGDSIPGLEGLDILNLDVSDAASLKAAAKEVEAKAGSLDLLVNNAGHGGGTMPLMDVDIDHAKTVFESNVWGLLRTTQIFVPLMLNDGVPPAGRKRIINIGSVVGVRAMPWAGIYGSSKHAVHGLNDVLRLELEPFNIGVTEIAPGLIGTNFSSNSNAIAQPLPASSFYKNSWGAVQADIDTRRHSGSDAEAFCQGVTNAITSSSPPNYYIAGSESWAFRLMMFVPSWIADFFLRPHFGLGKVAL